MQVKVTFLDSFCHGSLNAVMNRSTMMEKGMAQELERAGLLRISMKPVVAATPPPGKGSDDGQGQPSSVSPVAPASRETTVTRFESGATKIHRKER